MTKDEFIKENGYCFTWTEGIPWEIIGTPKGDAMMGSIMGNQWNLYLHAKEQAAGVFTEEEAAGGTRPKATP